MLRFRYVRIIARKELVDSLRDWRTLLVMIGLPIVLYPLLMIGSSELLMSQVEKVQKAFSKVAFLGAPEGQVILARLKAQPGIEIVPFEVGARYAPADTEAPGATTTTTEPKPEQPAGSGANPETAAQTDPARAGRYIAIAAALRAGTLHAVVLVESGFDANLDGNGAGRMRLFVDDANELSKSAGKKLRDILDVLADEIAEARLARFGHSMEFVNPLCITTQNMASPERMGGSIAGRFLPYILILMILMGAMYPAMDLTAGEKERKTMETLLVSPASRLELVTGKYVAIFIIALVSAVLNLASLAVSIARAIPMDQLGKAASPSSLGISFSISPWMVLGFIVFMVPVAGLFAGLSMAVSSFARTYKEAQLYITPLVLLTIMPAMISILPGVELTYGLSLVPITNVTLLFREVLAQQALTFERVVMAALVFGSTAVYAYMALRLAAWIFEGEGILLPSPEGPRLGLRLSSILGRGDAGVQKETATVEQSLLLLALVFLLQYYVTPYAVQHHARLGLAIVQVGLILLPTLLLARVLRVKPATGLALRLPTAGASLRAVLCGVLAFLAALSAFALQSLVTKPPTLAPSPVAQALVAHELPELLLVLGLAAMLPAVCEELLFRGMFLQAWRQRVGVNRAVIVSAAVFALLHLPIYRFVPVCIVGLVAGYMCVRSGSILPAMVVHLVYNAGVLVLEFSTQRGFIPPSLSFPAPSAALVFLSSAFLLWRLTRIVHEP